MTIKHKIDLTGYKSPVHKVILCVYFKFRVSRSQGKLKKSGNLCGLGKVREKYYF